MLSELVWGRCGCDIAAGQVAQELINKDGLSTKAVELDLTDRKKSLYYFKSSEVATEILYGGLNGASDANGEEDADGAVISARSDDAHPSASSQESEEHSSSEESDYMEMGYAYDSEDDDDDDDDDDDNSNDDDDESNWTTATDSSERSKRSDTSEQHSHAEMEVDNAGNEQTAEVAVPATTQKVPSVGEPILEQSASAAVPLTEDPLGAVPAPTAGNVSAAAPIPAADASESNDLHVVTKKIVNILTNDAIHVILEENLALQMIIMNNVLALYIQEKEYMKAKVHCVGMEKFIKVRKSGCCYASTWITEGDLLSRQGT
jgi:hypothetical protein